MQSMWLPCYTTIGERSREFLGKRVRIWYNNVEIMIGIMTAIGVLNPIAGEIYSFRRQIRIQPLDILLKNTWPVDRVNDYENMVGLINSLANEGGVSDIREEQADIRLGDFSHYMADDE